MAEQHRFLTGPTDRVRLLESFPKRGDGILIDQQQSSQPTITSHTKSILSRRLLFPTTQTLQIWRSTLLCSMSVHHSPAITQLVSNIYAGRQDNDKTLHLARAPSLSCLVVAPDDDVSHDSGGLGMDSELYQNLHSVMPRPRAPPSPFKFYFGPARWNLSTANHPCPRGTAA